MVRGTSVCKNGLRKGAWSEEEDNKLRAYILRYGHWNWQQLPKFAGLARCGKSCRLRWLNYLKPGLKKGSYSKEEEEMIIKLHQEIGNKWSVIAGKLPGRTDNEIKNYWHTRLKKLKKQDPNSIEKNEITSKNINVMDQKDQDSSMSSLVSTSHSQISSPTTYSSTILGLEDLVTENGSNGLIISPSTSCNSILIDSEESTFSSFWNEPMFSNASNGLNSPSTSGTNSSEVCTDEFMSGFWDEPFSMDTSYNMGYSILGPSFWD